MRVLTVANQKGGQAKSTLVVHLAYAATEAGLRVLVFDMDPQASASTTFVVDEAAPGLVASQFFGAEAPEGEPLKVSDNLSIIRGDKPLRDLVSVTADVKMRPARYLKRFAKDFDVCFIDTPGSLSTVTPLAIAGLIAADAVICPVALGLFESTGLMELVQFVRAVKTDGSNPRLQLLGLLPCLVDTTSAVEKEGLEELRSKLGSVMFPGMLPHRSSVKQAVARRRPVWRATKGAGHLAAAKEWRSVCESILLKLKVQR